MCKCSVLGGNRIDDSGESHCLLLELVVLAGYDVVVVSSRVRDFFAALEIFFEPFVLMLKNSDLFFLIVEFLAIGLEVSKDVRIVVD